MILTILSLPISVWAVDDVAEQPQAQEENVINQRTDDEVEEPNIPAKKIIYYTGDNKKLERTYNKINKYGFVENNTNSWETNIILNKEDALSLLRELYKSLKRTTLDVLTNKYFEDIHKLDFTYWNKEIRFTTSIHSSIVNLDRKVITDLINAYEAD